MHEAWYLGDPDAPDVPPALRAGYPAHSEAVAVAGIAAKAGVGRLVLLHLNPLLDEAAYVAMGAAARDVFPATDVLADGDAIDVGDA